MRICLLLLLIAGSWGCSEKQIRQTYEIITQSAEEVPLSEVEVVAALKDSLARGISRGVLIGGAENGYLDNARLKIPFPEDARKVEEALRKLGLGSEVDRFVTQLNRGAERAAGRAKPIFIKAITEMTIRDAFEVLNGDKDAATQYLRRKAGDDLFDEFLPVVSDTLEQVRATRYYGDIVKQYNRLPGVRKVDPELDEYATARAIDGLFLLIADEEANIRANPAARTTQLLRRVFSTLD